MKIDNLIINKSAMEVADLLHIESEDVIEYIKSTMKIVYIQAMLDAQIERIRNLEIK